METRGLFRRRICSHSFLCNVPPGGTLHRLFQSPMPNHRCPILGNAQSIGEKMGGAMCRWRAAHCTDLFNHRCPIHRNKNMEVQCAAAGRHIAPTFPIIDARSSMPDHRCPIHRKKIGRCNKPPAGGTLHRLFHSSERPLIGTPNRWERHCIPNRSEKPRTPLHSQQIGIAENAQ